MAHIQIIENKEVKMDLETKGIMAVVDHGDKVDCACVVENLTGEDLLNMLRSLDGLKERILKAHPELKLFYRLVQKAEPPQSEEDLFDDFIHVLMHDDNDEEN